MSAPCSRNSAAWPTRSTPTTRAKWPARPAATPAWASSKTTASANTQLVLDSAGIAGLFDTRIDGVIAKQRGLRGKPAPDTFLAAAEALGVPAAHAVVFEDAQAGVAAGHAGHFALVVGVDRVGQAAELREHGADIVVKDLADLLERDGQVEAGTR